MSTGKLSERKWGSIGVGWSWLLTNYSLFFPLVLPLVFRSTMQWIDPLIQSVCGRRERKNSIQKRKENCKMNELDIRGCKRWTRPDLKIRNSQTRAVNEWGIGIFSKIYNDHIYSPTQPAYAGPQGQPMELQGLKISDIVHIFLGDNHVAVELLPLACCKTQTLSKWIWTFLQIKYL